MCPIAYCHGLHRVDCNCSCEPFLFIRQPQLSIWGYKYLLSQKQPLTWIARQKRSQSTTMQGRSMYPKRFSAWWSTHFSFRMFSSCWIIIKNNVYDVTEFLSVRSVSSLFARTWRFLTIPACRYTLEALASFWNTLEVTQLLHMTQYTHRIQSKRIFHPLSALGRWSRLQVLLIGRIASP